MISANTIYNAVYQLAPSNYLWGEVITRFI